MLKTFAEIKHSAGLKKVTRLGPSNQSVKFQQRIIRAVVVAQLAERLLPIPEDPGSNPPIGNFY